MYILSYMRTRAGGNLFLICCIRTKMDGVLNGYPVKTQSLDPIWRGVIVSKYNMRVLPFFHSRNALENKATSISSVNWYKAETPTPV